MFCIIIYIITNTLITFGCINKNKTEKINEQVYIFKNKSKTLKNSVEKEMNKIIEYKKLDTQGNKNPELKELKSKIIESVLNSNIGFKNLGNTCYINSAVQFLINNKTFLESFIYSYFFYKFNEKNIVSNSLFKILLRKHLLKNSNEKWINIVEFKDAIVEANESMNYKWNEQEDVYFFIEMILNNIKNELPKFTYTTNIYEIEINKENNNIKDIIKKKKIKTNENFIIKINRVKSENNKIIKINENITIEEFIEISNTKYYLKSIVSHIGNKASSGHYVVYINNSNNKWLCYDDKKCYKCKYKNNINEINYRKIFTSKNIKQSAYLLLYEKINL